MVEYKYVDSSKAPAPPAKKTGSADVLIKMIEELPEGKTAVVTPAEGQSVRGLKTSIGRIASSRELKIQQWQADGDPNLYVKKLS